MTYEGVQYERQSKDRRKSQTVQVQYDSTTNRLLLDQDLVDVQETPVT
jgi:hypothetical protein